jgi:hypothetical protein
MLGAMAVFYSVFVIGSHPSTTKLDEHPLQPAVRTVVDSLLMHMGNQMALCLARAKLTNSEALLSFTRGEKLDAAATAAKYRVCPSEAVAIAAEMFPRARGKIKSEKVLERFKDLYSFWRTSISTLYPTGSEFLVGYKQFDRRGDALVQEYDGRAYRFRLDQ